MHMTDALLSPAVGGAMYAISAAANAYAVKKISLDELCEKKIPLMGVMGAFVFAAQMINFTIPATGASGHIGGGVLLAAMIGAFPALVTLSVVLAIQCLFFADGGLLALGCNIFNLAVVPCLIIFPLVFKPMVRKGVQARRISMASIVAVVFGLQLGSFGVVLQTRLSGITALPFPTFLLMMQPIHLAIGVAEGLITAAILCFVRQMRPEMIESALGATGFRDTAPTRRVLVAFAVLTLLVGAFLSLFASANPDGLEWAMERVAGDSEWEAKGALAEGAASIQEATALMPDYDFKGADSENAGLGTTAAGIAGGAITFLLAGAVAFAVSVVKKKQKSATRVSGQI